MLINPVDRRAAEIIASQKREQRSLDDCANELAEILRTEVASATKYEAVVQIEARAVVVVSYWKEMLGNRVCKEVAELHLKRGAPEECQVVFSDAIIPPVKFDYGISYDFDTAAEFVVLAMIESMALSIAAGCKLANAEMQVDISQATRVDYLELTQLFRAYAATLPVDFCTQGFDEEIAALPGQYAPPQGALLIARDGAAALGCVAMRPLGDAVAEMKRLYVTPEGRGGGLGRALTLAIIDAARAAGHRELRLDTLAHMAQAQALYRSLGFTEIAPYNDNPPDITTFMSLKL